jgi:putative ribosome biogenesis GTPase RsgA
MNANHDKMFEQGVVTQKSSAGYQVHLNGSSIACRISPDVHDPSENGDKNNRHKKGVTGHRDPVAVGDVVRLVRTAGQEYGQIVEILPRRSCLARRAAIPWPGAHAFEQVIAANVDQVVPVMAAAKPTPHWRLLDRYLVAAEAADLPSVICITKLDLVQAGSAGEKALREATEEYRQIGYTVLTVSAHSGANLDELKEALGGGEIHLIERSPARAGAARQGGQPGHRQGPAHHHSPGDVPIRFWRGHDRHAWLARIRLVGRRGRGSGLFLPGNAAFHRPVQIWAGLPAR